MYFMRLTHCKYYVPHVDSHIIALLRLLSDAYRIFIYFEYCFIFVECFFFLFKETRCFAC